MRSLDPEPIGRPMYDLMGNHAAFMDELRVRPLPEIMAEVDAEIRVAMDELGVRVVLFYGERMDDLGSVLEEMTG